MKTLAEWMREDDPLARTPDLSAVDVAAMRRKVIGAASTRPVRVLVWPKLLGVATVVMVMAVAGVTSRRQVPPSGALPTPDTHAAGATPRQLQFATPGGTRIIWTFDPDFTLVEHARRAGE